MEVEEMKFALFLLTSLVVCQTASGSLWIASHIMNVYYQGTSELVGTISFYCKGDDFPDASSQNPAYIKVSFGSDAVLSCTQVDMTGFGPPETASPLFLGMYLSQNTADKQILAPPDSVAIVRWIEGESEIWLRVESSSSE